MASNSIENEKMALSLSDDSSKMPSIEEKNAWPEILTMDDDQTIPEPPPENKSTDEIWRNIQNSRVRFPKIFESSDHGEGLRRTVNVKSPTGTETELVGTTTDHDASQKDISASLTGTDGGGGRDGISPEKEKPGRGSVESKMILKPSPSVGTSLVNLVNDVSSTKANGTESSGSMMDEAWDQLRSSFVYYLSER